MERHEKVARAHRAISWLYALLTMMFIAMLLLSRESTVTLPFVLLVLFFGCFFALHHFTAKGSFDKKPWARNTSRGIAVLMLFGFPIGTLIGVYLLVNSRGWESQPSSVESL